MRRAGQGSVASARFAGAGQMTLPASGAISMAQVNTELGRASTANDSLNDSWVRALAQVASGAISMNSLHGKTGRFDGTIALNSSGSSPSLSIPFFDQTLTLMVGGSSSVGLFSNGASAYFTGNVRLTNNSTGASAVLLRGGAGYSSSSIPSNLCRPGLTDNFTIIPSN